MAFNLIEKKTVEEHLADVNYDFPNYVPSKEAVKYINFIKLVNMSKGGEENSSPIVHMKILDSVFNMNKRIAVMSHRGIAKALSLDSKLYTDKGETTIGECKVGDRIIGEDGNFTTITHKSEVFNKGMFRINLEDGRSLNVSGDHINTVIHRRSVRKGHRVRTEYQRRDLTTWELMSYAITSTRTKTAKNSSGIEHNFWIPLCKPAQFSEKMLKLDPYQYGMALAKRKKDKRVYKTYKVGSYEQRLALLQGFFDVKGIVSNDGSVSFLSDKTELRDDIVDLIRSMGGIAKVNEDKVNIQVNVPLFRKENKLDKMNFSSKNKVAITSIEIMPIVPSQCISVDNESKTFVTDNYVITHNTTLMAEYFFLYIAVFGKLDGFGKVDLAIYVSDSMENGVKNLRRNIEYRYEESDFLREHLEINFTDQRLEFKNKDGHVFIVKCYGSKTGVRGSKEKGKRPQLALLDDLVSDADANSPTIISTIEDTVHKAVGKALHPSRSKTIWLGTPFNRRDPLYKAVESGVWHVSVYPVCEEFNEFTTKETFRGSWPDRFSYDYVYDEYIAAKEQGKLQGFYQELMLQVVSEEERVIMDDDIVEYDYMLMRENIADMNIYITTDFATSENKKADYSAVSVWAVNSNDDIIWIDGYANRQLMNMNIDKLFKLVSQYKPMSVGIEVSGQQAGFIDWIKQEMIRRKVYFNLASSNNSSKEGIRPRKNKLERMMEIQPRFKLKKIWFPRDHRTEVVAEIKSQLKAVTISGIKSKNDDLLDTISMLTEMPLISPSVESEKMYDPMTDSWMGDEDSSYNNSYIID